MELKAKQEKQREDEEREKQINLEEVIKQKQKVKRVQIAKITLAAILLFFIIFVSIKYIKPVVIKNQQYGSAIKLLNNGKIEYINVLRKYADSLVKKIYLMEEDPSNYYSVGDIDKDGLLEVAVYEKTYHYSQESLLPIILNYLSVLMANIV